MTDRIVEIPVDQIVPNPEQPRTEFDIDKLRELSASILSVGQLDPIKVEATSKPDVFILEDGERRLRAHKLGGLKTINAIVRPAAKADPEGRLARALVANLQRAGMNPVEEGKAFMRLRDEFEWKIAKISRITGAALLTIKNRIAIAELHPEIQALIIAKKLPKDHRAIEALNSVPSVEARTKLAHALASHPGMTVPAIERAAKRLNEQLLAAPDDEPNLAPAIKHGARKAAAGPSPLWRQLAKRKELPHWEVVKAAGDLACAKCPLFKKASDATCGNCPAVNLISGMIKVGNAIKS